MASCVFCGIVKKRHEQSKLIVYQDRFCTAFMDLIQQHPGHTLIVPNEHVRNIFELDEKLAGELFKVTTKMAKLVKRKFKPDGIDIYQCNERCAGQSVFHMHIHIFPRKKDDELFKIYNHHKIRWLTPDQVVKYKEMMVK